LCLQFFFSINIFLYRVFLRKKIHETVFLQISITSSIYEQIFKIFSFGPIWSVTVTYVDIVYDCRNINHRMINPLPLLCHQQHKRTLSSSLSPPPSPPPPPTTTTPSTITTTTTTNQPTNYNNTNTTTNNNSSSSGKLVAASSTTHHIGLPDGVHVMHDNVTLDLRRDV